jgi:putative flippase GtrA
MLKKIDLYYFIRSEKIRFIAAGGFNTLIGYLIYLTILSFYNYFFAFTISFIFSIVIAFAINCLFVFKVTFSWRRLLKYPIIYLLHYIIGVISLYVLINYFSLNEKIAPLINAVVLTPFSFIVNKCFFSRRNFNVDVEN